MWVSHLCGSGRYVCFVPGRRGVRSERLCDCKPMWDSFDPREWTICAIAGLENGCEKPRFLGFLKKPKNFQKSTF